MANHFNYWEHWSLHGLVPWGNVHYISLQKSWQMAGPQKPAYMESYLVSVVLLILGVCIKREKLFGEATLSAGIRKLHRSFCSNCHEIQCFCRVERFIAIHCTRKEPGRGLDLWEKSGHM